MPAIMRSPFAHRQQIGWVTVSKPNTEIIFARKVQRRLHCKAFFFSWDVSLLRTLQQAPFAMTSSHVSFFPEREAFLVDVALLCGSETIGQNALATAVAATAVETAGPGFCLDDTSVVECIDSVGTSAASRLSRVLDRYQEQPQLLDGELPSVLSSLMSAIRLRLQPASAPVRARLHALARAVYSITKLRGAKRVLRLFPHAVADLEPVLECLAVEGAACWELRFVLLLWLTTLVLVPFDLHTVDSTTGAGGGIIARLVTACQTCLCEASSVRVAAALCVSRLLSRPDMDRDHLLSYCEWATRALTLCAGAGSSSDFAVCAIAQLGLPTASVSAATRGFLAAGALQSIVEVAKHGHREATTGVLTEALRVTLALASVGGAGTGLFKGSPLLRKLLVKLAARTALSYLPPRVAAWRYQRGQRRLLDNLSQAGVAAARQRIVTGEAAPPALAAGTAASTGGKASAASQRHNDDDDAPVPAMIEDVVEMLLQGLRDVDTVVRWSAAKGLGRVTARLPRGAADDVVAAVLELPADGEGDGAWHGGCLALAELARRGLLLPSRLPVAVSALLRALSYDVRRGAHSVGAHVRDAACYACWAFARAYEPALLRPHVRPLAAGMLCCALFDREVNCRRAAAAAFQENVGRQGDASFPHGIAILAAADYYSLGSREGAYLAVAPRVARFAVYRGALTAHLLRGPLRHWDASVRMLAARALGRTAGLEPDAWREGPALPMLLADACAPGGDLAARHGALAALGEIALALARLPARAFPPARADALRNTIVVAEKSRAYTGRGGEAVRAAVCRLVACQALADHALSRRAALRLLQSVDDALRHPNEHVQAAALAALRALAAHAFAGAERDADVLDRLPRAYIARLRDDDNPSVRRGAALALGALPRALLTARGGAGDSKLLDAAILALVNATRPERAAAARDAETRRNAAMALADLVETVGFGERAVTRVVRTANAGRDAATAAPASAAAAAPRAAAATSLATHVDVERADGLSPAQLDHIWSALFAAAHDYSTDNRGDVGSWVRKAALEGLHRIVALAQAALAGEARVQRLLDGLSAAAGARSVVATAEILLPADSSQAVEAALSELEELRTPSMARLAVEALAAASARGAGTDDTAAVVVSGSGAGAVPGFHDSLAGYGAGMRLLGSSASCEATPDALAATNGLRLGSRVACAHGRGRVTKIVAAGSVCEVAFDVGDAPAFPYGVGLLRCKALARCAARAPGARELVLVRAVDGGAGLHAFLAAPGRMSSQLLGATLRAAVEKLDLLRGVAGELLCRTLHAPFPLPPLPAISHENSLRAAFPPLPAAVRSVAFGAALLASMGAAAGDFAAASLLPDVTEIGAAAAVVTASNIDGSGDADAADDDAASDADEGGDEESGTPLEARPTLNEDDATAAGEVATAGDSANIQWALPHHSFPRLVPLLELGSPYLRPLAAGLVTAVGGLSESVVRQATSSLTRWTAAARRAGAHAALAELADALIAQLLPRPQEAWEATADFGSAAACAGEDLSTSSGTLPATSQLPVVAVPARRTVLESRLLTPTLVTLDVLLRAGALDSGPAAAWAAFADTLASAARARALPARDDAARVLAACDVCLSLLCARRAPSARVAAALTALDILGHPFPAVRRATAERLYVRLLALDAAGDTCDDDCGESGGSSVPPSVHFADAAAALAGTAWDASRVDALRERDTLYRLLGLGEPPISRSGVDPSIFAGATAAASAAAAGFDDGWPSGPNADDYGSLVRDVGF